MKIKQPEHGIGNIDASSGTLPAGYRRGAAFKLTRGAGKHRFDAEVLVSDKIPHAQLVLGCVEITRINRKPRWSSLTEGAIVMPEPHELLEIK